MDRRSFLGLLGGLVVAPLVGFSRVPEPDLPSERDIALIALLIANALHKLKLKSPEEISATAPTYRVLAQAEGEVARDWEAPESFRTLWRIRREGV